MALGINVVNSQDGGLGVTGPGGITQLAAIGVSSSASVVASQLPVVVTSAADVTTLFGIGPLARMLKIALRAAGGRILAMPLQRGTDAGVLTFGGTVRADQQAQTQGSMRVTGMNGHALGESHVRLEWTVAGEAGDAAFRLIVDGVAYPEFAPTNAAAFAATGVVIPAASLGPLATGVAAANQFKPIITVPDSTTPAVVGDGIEFDFTEPKAAAADFTTAVTKLADHVQLFEEIRVAGVVSRATAALLHTAARALPGSHGEYVGVHVQTAGPDAVTGGAHADTAAWVTDLQSNTNLTTPARLSNPRLYIWAPWCRMRDPDTNRRIIVPAQYPAMGMTLRREPFEPLNEIGEGEYGVLAGVEDIYPLDISHANLDALDDVFYSTLQYHGGRPGVYIGEARLWGVYPQTGIAGTDYTGSERRRVMDAACRLVKFATDPKINGRVPVNPDTGRMATAFRIALGTIATSSLRGLESVGALYRPRVVVTDKEPGILQTDTVLANISFVPEGKARRIEQTLEFARSAATSVAEEAA